MTGRCGAGFALTPTLSQGERVPSYALALWERVAGGRVRAAGPAFLYDKGSGKSLTGQHWGGGLLLGKAAALNKEGKCCLLFGH